MSNARRRLPPDSKSNNLEGMVTGDYREITDEFLGTDIVNLLLVSRGNQVHLRGRVNELRLKLIFLGPAVLYHEAEKDEGLALFILSRPYLLNKLGRYNQAAFNQLHNEFWPRVDQEQQALHSGQYLFNLCEKWPSVRDEVLRNEDLRSRLSEQQRQQLQQSRYVPSW